MAEKRKRPRGTDPDEYRMTLGEHLDELRRCVVRSLVGLVLACVVCIWPAKYLLELIARPVVLTLERHGQPATLLATHPVENFLVYVKVVLIFGFILAAPYILYQLWSFAASGLYAHERRWVHRLAPASVGLFLLGVAFMYSFVLIVSLNFLIGFSGWLPQPDPRPNAFERQILRTHDFEEPAGQPTGVAAPRIPLLNEDPNHPAPGTLWVNMPERKLKVRFPEERTYSVQILRDDKRALVTTHFKIGEYLSFVLVMTIAFGVAFQMPLVVIFLARTGIMRVEAMRKYRKVVILLIVVAAGILAPPDLLSHLLLSGPMILLFELGLLLAGRAERRRARPAGAENAGE